MTRRADTTAARGELREEAAGWFALMRGPDAEARRAEFDAWMLRGPEEREAYNRIAETFSLGKSLRYEHLPPAVDDSAHTLSTKQQTRSRALVMAMVTILAMGALALAWLGSGSGVFPWFGEATPPANTNGLRLATGLGEIRQFRLPDGSVATLDTNSVVLVRFDGDRRDLGLMKGRARFSVAHERRPFVVVAAAGSVTAVGTVFDVALGDHGQMDVRLLKGVVDVAIASPAAQGRNVRRLSAGEALTLAGTAPPVIARLRAAPDADWPKGLRDFDAARIADVAADANRYGTVRLHAADADVAGMRISGTFRVGDTRQLASNMAAVLGLALITRPGEIELARQCPAADKKNCIPPS